MRSQARALAADEATQGREGACDPGQAQRDQRDGRVSVPECLERGGLRQADQERGECHPCLFRRRSRLLRVGSFGREGECAGDYGQEFEYGHGYSDTWVCDGQSL